jgi:hypothetical protein
MSERGYPGNGRIIEHEPPIDGCSDPSTKIRHYGHIGLSLIPTHDVLAPQILWTVDSSVFEQGKYPDIEEDIRQFLDGLECSVGFVVEITDASYAGDCVCDLYSEAAILALKQAIAGLHANGEL